MYQLSVRRYQWIIDLAFGLAFLLPMVLYILDIVPQGGILVSIGIGIGYMIHVTQKMLIFSEMLDDVVNTKVKREATEQVEEKTDEKVEEKLDDRVEEKTDEKVEEKLDDRVEEEVEEQLN